MRIASNFFLQLLFLLLKFHLFGANHTRGSDNSVGYPELNFGVSAGNNKIANYALINNGFTLQDFSTTCSCNSVFPISGVIDFNGGKLQLGRDLVLGKNFAFARGGYIDGGNHSLEHPKKNGPVHFASDFTLKNLGLVFNSDVLVDASLIFKSMCKISGRGRKLIINPGSKLLVDHGSRLVFENFKISGLFGANLKCLDNGGSIAFKNCKIGLSGDFEFGKGSIFFSCENNISGTSLFTYSTPCASTIDSHSKLSFGPHTTLKYSPDISNRDLIHMKDKSSSFCLNGCTLYSTTTGMRLTRGRLFLDNNVTLSSSSLISSEVICLGDGDPNNDLDIQFLSGATLNVYGALEYENVN